MSPPNLVVNPVLYPQNLLHGSLGSLRRALSDHLFLWPRSTASLYRKILPPRCMAVLLDQDVQRLHQVPGRRIHLRLQTRMHIVRRAAAPLSPLEINSSSTTPFAPSATCLHIAILPRFRLNTPTQRLSSASTSGVCDHLVKMRRGNFLLALAHEHEVNRQFLPAALNAMSALRKEFSGPF